MSGEPLSKTFANAVVSTAVGELPAMIKVGGKALLRHLQCDPINISGVSTVMQVISQAVVPQWALDGHTAWGALARKGVQSTSLANDIGIDQISPMQAALAELEGFSKAVFVISNLTAALGSPKLAAALSHLENPSLETALGDEAGNVVLSMYSSTAVHSLAQKEIVRRTGELTDMVAPLFSSRDAGSFEMAELDSWALSKSPDPSGDLLGKLLISTIAVSRFGAPATPIQYPLVAAHLTFAVSLAVIFGFRLTCDGKIIHRGDGDSPHRIDLVRGGDFKRGEEIICDIRSLAVTEGKPEGLFDYLNLHDMRLQVKIDLQSLSASQRDDQVAALRLAIQEASPMICQWEDITLQAARATIQVLAALVPGNSEPIFNEEDVNTHVTTVFMLELLQRAISGPILNLCTLVENAEEWLLYSAIELIKGTAQMWAKAVWKFLHALAPESQTEMPFATIIGGQAGVLVPTLLLVRKHAELMGCAAPITVLPGVLTVKGRRQQLLNEAMPGVTAPLNEHTVDKVTRATCIWRNVDRIVTLQGANLSYRYRVHADAFAIDIAAASQMWLQTVYSSSDVAQGTVGANASDYICSNVDSAPIRCEATTVWLTCRSLAGKLLFLSSLGSFDLEHPVYSGSSEQTGSSRAPSSSQEGTSSFKIYIAEQESFTMARQKAAALTCNHIMV